MKKVFILKANMPTFWAGDICLLEDDGSLWWVGNQDRDTQKRERELHWKEKVCMFSKKTLDKFKILESGWFEEMPKDLFERIFPWEGCAYWYVTDNGIDLGHWWCSTDDLLRKSLGNCFLNQEDAQMAFEKVRTICSINEMSTELTTTTVTEKGDFTITGKFVPECYEGMKIQLDRLVRMGKQNG